MGYFNNTTWTKVLHEIAVVLLIVLFSYTAISKLTDFRSFEWQMLNQPLPRMLNQVLIWTLPAIEIITVLLLLFQRTRLCGLLFSTSLLLVFTLYVAAILLVFFPRIPCSCGGVLASMSWEVHLIFNIVMMLIACVGIWTEVGRKT